MNLDFLKDGRPFDMDSGLGVLRSGGAIVLSWGIENIQPLKVKKEEYGMSFEVNGMHFQGTVILSINGLDYYEVRFAKDGEIIEDMTVKDVCVFDLIDTIDKIVEYVPSYG
jgi:hypothetical protein